jgi:hypothetical protein
LKVVLRRLLDKPGCRVLDLGPALGGNVGFLSRYAPKLFIADLYNTLRSRSAGLPSEPKKLERLISQDLPAGLDGPFDLILAWDLLNYFGTVQMSSLARRLAGHCHADSLVFALISTLKRIPDRPIKFEIVDVETLRYTIDSPLGRSSPMHKEPDLNRGLPGFEVEASFLLRNGLQEYILSSV